MHESLPVCPQMLAGWDGRKPHWQREIAAWKRCLIKDFPPPDGWKVSVVTRCSSKYEHHGECYLDEAAKVVRIIIARADWHVMVSTLWHEWAHIVDQTHGDKFHRRYGQIYRFYIEGTK